MSKLTAILAIGLLIVSAGASAGGQKQWRDPGHSSAHPDRYDYAKVVDVRPIYREVEMSNPVRECWDEPVYDQRRGHRASAGQVLAGGILGGIIGHQIGKGNHQRIATAMGTLIGAQIGKQSAEGHGRGHRQLPPSGYREQCKTINRVSYERVVDAYSVTYSYKGERYQVEMPYHPGKRIKMHIQATPVI